LFKIFNEALDSIGVFANEGKMVDASFVEAPRQRNTREENKHIKETGTAPEKWKEKPAIKRSPGHGYGSNIYLALWKTA